MDNRILKWFKENPNVTKWINFFTRVLIFICFVLWIFRPYIEETFKIGFLIDFEPSFAILSGVSLILNKVLSDLLKDSEYSPSYALATGYIKNFISPAITQLIEDGVSKPRIYVFKPNTLEELSSDNIDRMKAKLKNKKYDLSVINLSMKNGRAKDLMIINKKNGKQIYFDFPNTLLSLFAYVEYKLDTKANTSAEDNKEKIVKDLIKKFYEKLDALIIEYKIQDNVFTCGDELNVFD